MCRCRNQAPGERPNRVIKIEQHVEDDPGLQIGDLRKLGDALDGAERRLLEVDPEIGEPVIAVVRRLGGFEYALGRPELGLSNWQFGRLFGRGGVLSGDSVFTVRTRAIQDDPDIGR